MYPAEMVNMGMELKVVRQLYAVRQAEKGQQRAMIARLPKWKQIRIQQELKELDKEYEGLC